MSEELGRKLTEAHCNKALIYTKLGIRIGFAALIVFYVVRRTPGGPANIMAGIILALIGLVGLAFVLWPATHFKDYVEFYEYGICYCGQRWTFERLGNLSFREYKSNASFFTNIYMDGKGKRFDVTYIKDAKKQYNRAYSDYYELKK